ncbi:uncharacterized protein LOC119765573 [Culex quinquefasciatus]|uniref:uncharacterized protein LOC119765573 n=1 Tax=Culex quinquefasciatus TaxID=7176 RepID=UPI0018E338DD|nr:uncharacterized protein LOC119765573 [Culex quinquefasciatus]
MELMKLLEPQQEEDVCGGSGYLLETVFVKGQQGPAEFGFECEDVEEMVTIKQEVVGSNDEDEVEEGMEQVVGSDDDSAPRRKKPESTGRWIRLRWPNQFRCGGMQSRKVTGSRTRKIVLGLTGRRNGTGAA